LFTHGRVLSYPCMEATHRTSRDRGRTRLDWLDSRHSFSFGDFRRAGWDGFRDLRVLNEDVVAPGRGFGPHPHRDAEILSFVLEGALLHEDSTGSRSRIAAGAVQQMSAGAGVAHAEWNASEDAPVRFVQVWLLPERRGGAPAFHEAEPHWRERSGPVLVAARDGRAGSLPIRADAAVYAARLGRGEGFVHAIEPGRAVWIQMLAGVAEASGQRLEAGDGFGVERTDAIEVTSSGDSELLLFDLA